MLKTVEAFLKETIKSDASDRFLVAVSGGVDSMSLCDMFERIKKPFGIAHANFKLRGEDSDKDTAFVRDWALQHGITFHHQDFDAEQTAKDTGKSIQEACRDLRYAWFEDLMMEHGYNWVATAHHLNDTLETVLFNLTKGTGWSGITGIPPVNGKIIRPLLNKSKEDILAYAKRYNVKWREDTSNAESKYKRNLIRNKVIPLLKEINPNLEHTFAQTIKNFTEGAEALKENSEEIKNEITRMKDGRVYIDLDRIRNLPYRNSILYYVMSPYGFNNTQIMNVYGGPEAKPGARVENEKYTIKRDRHALIIERKFERAMNPVYVLADANQFHIDGKIFKIKLLDRKAVPPYKKGCAYFDFDKLEFPILVRPWKDGDRFMPIGLDGSKLISDHLTDMKLDRIEKEQALIMLSGGDICWSIPYRIDERFAVTKETKKIFHIEPE